MTDHKVLLYVEKETKLSCSIRYGMVYDEDQIGQRREILEKYDLH